MIRKNFSLLLPFDVGISNDELQVILNLGFGDFLLAGKDGYVTLHMELVENENTFVTVKRFEHGTNRKAANESLS